MNPKSFVLALFGPLIAAGAAWLCAAAGKYGVHLDQSGVNALAVAGATAGVGLVLKLIHELERKQPAATSAVESVIANVEKADPSAKATIEQAVESVVAGAWPASPTPEPSA